MLNYQKVFLRDGKLGSGIPLHRICICHGTSSPAASLADFARTPWLCLRSKIESLPRPKKKPCQSSTAVALKIAGDRWRSRSVPGHDLNHATGLTIKCYSSKVVNAVTVICVLSTFLIRLNNVQKTHKQSGDFTNRNGMDTRKNSGEFPGKKQLQTFFFVRAFMERLSRPDLYTSQKDSPWESFTMSRWDESPWWIGAPGASHPIPELNPWSLGLSQSWVEHGLMMPQPVVPRWSILWSGTYDDT